MDERKGKIITVTVGDVIGILVFGILLPTSVILWGTAFLIVGKLFH